MWYKKSSGLDVRSLDHSIFDAFDPQNIYRPVVLSRPWREGIEYKSLKSLLSLGIRSRAATYPKRPIVKVTHTESTGVTRTMPKTYYLHIFCSLPSFPSDHTRLRTTVHCSCMHMSGTVRHCWRRGGDSETSLYRYPIDTWCLYPLLAEGWRE
jgi:hypothetical protein